MSSDLILQTKPSAHAKPLVPNLLLVDESGGVGNAVLMIAALFATSLASTTNPGRQEHLARCSEREVPESVPSSLYKQGLEESSFSTGICKPKASPCPVVVGQASHACPRDEQWLLSPLHALLSYTVFVASWLDPGDFANTRASGLIHLVLHTSQA